MGLISFAIDRIESNIRLETIGDFLGLLIMLIKTKIVVVDGERGANDIYKAETVSFKVNPLISQFFNANVSDKEFNANDIMYHLKRNNILDDILNREKINYGYEKCIAKYRETPNKNTLIVLEQLKKDKEAIEMKPQCSNAVLNSINGISVKIIQNYLN